MLAILLAGGHATRLWPITRHRAKPLLPLGKETILDRLLDQLEPVATEVLVSTNELFASQFEEALEGRSNARLVVESQASEEEKPGALGALLQILEGLPEDEPVLVAGGDNVYGFDLAAFAEAAKDKDGPTVAVKDLADPALASQFGIVELEGSSRIKQFHEKPEDPPTTLAATALYYYPVGWRDLFDTYEAHARSSVDPSKMLDAPGRILEWAVQKGNAVHAWAFPEAWYDIGTAEGYFEALHGVLGEQFLEGEIEGSKTGSGVYVFPGATAKDAILQETILLPGAHVEQATLENVVVDEGGHVEGLSLKDSLVGPHTVLRAGP